jgi:hypothetical protein
VPLQQMTMFIGVAWARGPPPVLPGRESRISIPEAESTGWAGPNSDGVVSHAVANHDALGFKKKRVGEAKSGLIFE